MFFIKIIVHRSDQPHDTKFGLNYEIFKTVSVNDRKAKSKFYYCLAITLTVLKTNVIFCVKTNMLFKHHILMLSENRTEQERSGILV